MDVERWLTDEGRVKIDRLFAEVEIEFVDNADVQNYEDDGITCDCCPDHLVTRQLPNPRGWKGKVPVALDGNTWPLDFAAKMLECSEKDLRDLIRIFEVEPAGTLKMSSYRRSGRHPRAYDAAKLVELWDGVEKLRRQLNA